MLRINFIYLLRYVFMQRLHCVTREKSARENIILLYFTTHIRARTHVHIGTMIKFNNIQRRCVSRRYCDVRCRVQGTFTRLHAIQSARENDQPPHRSPRAGISCGPESRQWSRPDEQIGSVCRARKRAAAAVVIRELPQNSIYVYTYHVAHPPSTIALESYAARKLPMTALPVHQPLTNIQFRSV